MILRDWDWLVIMGEVDGAKVSLTSFCDNLIWQVDGIGDQDDGEEHHDDVDSDVHVDTLLHHSIHNVRTLESMIGILSSSVDFITILFTRSNVNFQTTFFVTVKILKKVNIKAETVVKLESHEKKILVVHFDIFISWEQVQGNHV